MSFINTLTNINRGKLIEELDDVLREAAQTAVATRKKSSVTLSLTIKPPKGDSPILTIEHDVKLKAPDFDRPATYLWATKTGQLVPNDPEQQQLQLKSVKRPDEPSAPVETVDTTTGEIIKAS